MDNERWSMIKPHQIPYETMTHIGYLCFVDTRTFCYGEEDRRIGHSYLSQSEMVNLLGMHVGCNALDFFDAKISLEFLYICNKGI